MAGFSPISVKIAKKNGAQNAPCDLTLSRRFVRYSTVTSGDEALTRMQTYRGDVFMRFIRRFVMIASYVLVFLGAAQAQSVTIGQTTVLSAGDNGNGNLLLAQSAKLATAATIQSLSFYVTAASGNLILGIYDATGPNAGPGALKASTASFTTKTGWNTAKVVTPVALTAGNYWLAYLPSSSNLSFVKTNASGNCMYYGYNFGAMPGKFSTSPTSCTYATWSLYATLATSTTPSGGTIVTGACGSSNGATLTSTPSANLCSSGTASAIGGAGPWSWTCAGSNGGTTATCSALKATSAQAVNGACGSSNGASLTSAPTTNLCSVGTASAVSGSGPWLWNCAGSNGGSTASCSATLKTTSSGSTGTSSSSGSGSTSFVALHTYYMSPTGNDGNSGTDAAHPWATPKHSVKCGDVIIAAKGNYSEIGYGKWGAVSNCPSTSGGIDGAGGIYFAILLCGDASVGNCQVNHPTNYNPGIDPDQNNWAVEGWMVDEGYKAGASGYGFSPDTGAAQRHHLAFINNISQHNAFGFSVNSEGAGSGGIGNGVDYWAIVGNIAQDSAGRNDCCWDAAIDVIGVKNWDAVAGTHVFLDGNFSYNDQQTTGGNSDGECYMFDTLDGLDYTQTIVMKNNISAICERYGVNFTYQGISNDALTLKVYQNTFYGGSIGAYTNDGPGGDYGDINVSANAYPWKISIYNNLVQERLAHPTNAAGSYDYALEIGGNLSTVTVGGSGTQNFLKGLATVCLAPYCDPVANAASYGTLANLGTNTYISPAYNNPTDFFNYRMGTPSCSGFQTTTACMGWNYASQTATNPSVIYDLTATASGTAGKGYQPPGPCASDSDYPTWLKGVVYLQWDGTQLWENAGLVNKPCGL
jgi:hypothetical protein